MPERQRRGRRGNNEGSIYFDKSKQRWYGQLTLADGTLRKLSAPTREEVSSSLVKLVARRNLGLPQPAEDLTVGGYLTDWLEQSAKGKLRVRTYETYAHYINAHIIPALGKHRLARLEPRYVQAFLNDRIASGRAPRTVQQMHAILRSALNRALKWDLVARNVATLVDVPRGPAKAIAPLERAQAEQLLQTAQGHPCELLYAFLLATGVRLGEALALRWSDVDVPQRRVHVRHTLVRPKGKPWQLDDPKSERGKRLVPLAPPAIAALAAQKDRTIWLHKKADALWHEHDLVFPSAVGTPLDGTNVYHAFKRLLAKAGLPDSHRVHDLRHSTATYLLGAGVDPRIVMDIMGWSQASMLQRYQHVLPAMLDDAADKLHQFLPNFSPEANSG